MAHIGIKHAADAHRLHSGFPGYQSLLNGIGGQGGGIVQIELAHDVGAVLFNGFYTDILLPAVSALPARVG